MGLMMMKGEHGSLQNYGKNSQRLKENQNKGTT